MNSIKIVRKIFRDNAGVLCSTTLAVMPDGKTVKAPVVGCVWRDKTWQDGETRYSREEQVMEVGGKLFRVGAKVAKPLVLKSGEDFRPTNYYFGCSFLPLGATK